MVVTSGLPLLMVKGKFCSLETMTVEELETFIPFMTQCSVHRAFAEMVNDTPTWWLTPIPFRFPLKKPRALSATGYRRHLVSVCCRCYVYHDQQYILQFCSQLANNPESVTAKANSDDTTSLYYSKTRLHILTFNNVNQEYDKNNNKKDAEVTPVTSQKKPATPRKCLMPSRPAKPITDVYLCENCDSEFTNQAAISAHERQCYGKRENLPEAVAPTPADLLGYLKLGRGPPPVQPQVALKMSLMKNKKVEFSSSFGQRILKSGFGKRDTVSEWKVLRSIENYEAYCEPAPPAPAFRDGYEFRGSYRSQRRQTFKGDVYGRPYCFSVRERRERYITLKTGLDRRSRALKRLCKRCEVPITRVEAVETVYLPPLPPLTPLPPLHDPLSFMPGLQGPQVSSPESEDPLRLQGPLTPPPELQGPLKITSDFQGPLIPPPSLQGPLIPPPSLQGPLIPPPDLQGPPVLHHGAEVRRNSPLPALMPCPLIVDLCSSDDD